MLSELVASVSAEVTSSTYFMRKQSTDRFNGALTPGWDETLNRLEEAGIEPGAAASGIIASLLLRTRFDASLEAHGFHTGKGGVKVGTVEELFSGLQQLQLAEDLETAEPWKVLCGAIAPGMTLADQLVAWLPTASPVVVAAASTPLDSNVPFVWMSRCPLGDSSAGTNLVTLVCRLTSGRRQLPGTEEKTVFPTFSVDASYLNLFLSDTSIKISFLPEKLNVAHLQKLQWKMLSLAICGASLSDFILSSILSCTSRSSLARRSLRLKPSR